MLYFYWYLYLLLWFLACLAPYISIHTQKNLLAFYCGIWAFVFGFRRHDVGNDTPGYVAFFENKLGNVPLFSTSYGTIDHPNDGIEEGFVLLSRLFNLFTENVTIIFTIIGLIIWGVIYYLYKKYSKTPLLSLFFMLTITGTMFYTLQVAIRQSLSMIIVCIGLILLINARVNNWKKMWKNKRAIVGLFLCLLSVSIHRTTGIILCLFLVLFFIRFTKKTAYIVIVLFSLIAVWGAETISYYFDHALYLIGGFSNENFNVLSERYIGNMSESRFSKGAFIAWLILTLLTIYLTESKKMNSFFIKVFIGAYCAHQFFQYSLVHTRLVALFIMMGYIASVPNVCKKDNRLYFVYLMIGVFLLILNYGWFSNWPVLTDKALPFYFIWQ